ncbi:protein A3 [Aotine betaherpesvirus 1]|uniref:Protein A3 n=1 Tax=Aotine betaherpesvirus 1 TaxID=50290 RepID=G8XU76_9BETA|nr:protein A3 [Aotine betaherpesvirus 1]AEV80813.1 protein A3 [Aotine betaherpesvirus 1]
MASNDGEGIESTPLEETRQQDVEAQQKSNGKGKESCPHRCRRFMWLVLQIWMLVLQLLMLISTLILHENKFLSIFSGVLFSTSVLILIILLLRGYKPLPEIKLPCRKTATDTDKKATGATEYQPCSPTEQSTEAL